MLGATDAVLSIFYSYPPALIASWCGVSVPTARAYKAGRRRPSRAVVRLFLLHRDRRVLDAGWKGWGVKDDSIVDPDGNETSRLLLHNYFFVMQYARHLAREHSPEAHNEFYELLSGKPATGVAVGSSRATRKLTANERAGLIQGQGAREPPERLPPPVAAASAGGSRPAGPLSTFERGANHHVLSAVYPD